MSEATRLFGSVAAAYARHRITYPAAFYVAVLAFPGEEWPFPAGLWIERHWSLSELIAPIGTWSAVQRSREAGIDPLPALQAELAALWPDAGPTPLTVRWPFMGRWGQVWPAEAGPATP